MPYANTIGTSISSYCVARTSWGPFRNGMGALSHQEHRHLVFHVEKSGGCVESGRYFFGLRFFGIAAAIERTVVFLSHDVGIRVMG